MNALTLLIGVAAAFAGAGLGLVYFAALRRSVGTFATGAGWQMVVLLSILRVSLAIAAFALIAKLGMIPVLGAAAGFLLARTISIRRVQRQN